MSLNLEKITLETIDTAKIAATIIKNSLLNKEKIQIDLKGKNDFVTNIDKESEIVICEKLSKICPFAGFITEEKTRTNIEEYNWIIDPLDGTTNFINSLYPVAVSIALAKKDEILLGVVLEIGLDECFYAYKNSGAFLNGKKIFCSETKSLQDSLLATGFPANDFTNLKKQINIFEILIQNSKSIRRLGSSATDLVYVACGRFDGYYKTNICSHDLAAGSFIIKEAGGKNSDFLYGDNFLARGEIISSNPYIHNDIQEIIRKFY